MTYLFLLIPVCIGTVAMITDNYYLKALQTAACIVLVAVFGRNNPTIQPAFLLIALSASIIGDYYLSHKVKNENYFVYGIGLYFIAHIGYLIFCLQFGIQSTVLWIAAPVIFLGFILYFFLRLRSRIEPAMLRFSVLAYLLISCSVLSLAIAGSSSPMIHWLVIAGISLIVFSDTIIAESEFGGKRKWAFLILPTYYLAQIALTATLIHTSIIG